VPAGCHGDTVWRDGAPTPLPPPPEGVPRRLLRGLKRLFDPIGELPAPDWLTDAREVPRGDT